MEETMTRLSFMKSLLAAGSLALLCGPVHAQQCREGMTAYGICSNEDLAASMRGLAIIFSQPKISQTAYPVLPSVDRSYRYPNQLNPDPNRASATGKPIPVVAPVPPVPPPPPPPPPVSN
jgi:hypothetical protein